MYYPKRFYRVEGRQEISPRIALSPSLAKGADFLSQTSMLATFRSASSLRGGMVFLGLYDSGNGVNRTLGFRAVHLGQRRCPVPKHQVTEPVDIAQQDDGQAHQVVPALHPDGLEEKASHHEAEEQPQEEAEYRAHAPHPTQTEGEWQQMRRTEESKI
jgi:hypothetical protein